MFFVLSKVVFWVIAPSSFCVLLMGTGLLLWFRERWRRWSNRLVVAGFALLLIFGFSPIGQIISAPLEDRFASVPAPPASAITHIIVLGGAEQANIARARGRLGTNASGERFLEIPALARRYPKAKIVFTGGYGWITGEPLSGANDVSRHLISVGIPRERILLESRSKNTWQNAKFVKDLLAAEKTPCPCGYLLVTSAWHMPRSIGVFRKLGYDNGKQRLYPWPVDYRTEGAGQSYGPNRWLHEGLRQTDLGTKEWIGLTAYWLAGRTSAWWPAPRPVARRAREPVK